MVEIHPSAVVDPRAELGTGVAIGPFCRVDAGARLGDGVRLESHVVISGQTTIGAGTGVWPFAALGGEPQSRGDDGSRGRVEIGAECVVREHATVHRGTAADRVVTTVGDRVWLMAGAHVAHDCRVGDDVTLTNGVSLGGHSSVGDGAVLGALAGIHQHVRIGDGAMIGAGSMVARDVPPWTMAIGDRATLRGLNLVGLRRAGAGRDEIRALRELLDALFGDRDVPLADAVAAARSRAAASPLSSRAEVFLAFAGGPSRRGFVRLGAAAGSQ